MRERRYVSFAYSCFAAAMIADAACTSSPRSALQSSPEEPLEDPVEEQGETAADELNEEASESGPAGTSGAAGGGVAHAAGGSSASGGAPAIGGIGGETPSGGTSGVGGANQGGLSGGGGVVVAGGGGAGGAGAGGATTGGTAGNGGVASATGGAGPQTYPPLTAAQIGRATRIATSTPLTLAEGPLWDPCEHRLLFVDVSASVIYSLSSTDQMSVFATNTGNANGIASDLDGSLILAQMAPPGHIARRDKSGNIQPINPPGPSLHTPDDVTIRSDGTIYFTDGEFPPVGTVNLGPLPVYGFKPGASMLMNGGTVNGPNGIEFSPDESILYVDAYFQGAVVKFNVASDGSLTKGAALATGLTNPDSLCVDAAGNLYVGVSTGLQVLSPTGTRVALVSVASTQGVTNCEFGGDDGKTLYITAWTGVWKVPGMPIPGLQWQENRQRLGCM